jgi:thiol-disulfide isomerase/thioredoxin
MNRASHLFAIGLLALTRLGMPTSAADFHDAAPAFDLPQHGGNLRGQLTNLTGRVVVLDFFAHWCVPCIRASTELESGVRQFYESRNGNAHGLKVELLAINIDASQPAKTEAFIRRTGLTRVFDDLQGEVFKRYGGSGMPFLVIIDATDGTSGNAPARIVYRKAGFEGVAKLREVIDGISEVKTAPPATLATVLEGVAGTRLQGEERQGEQSPDIERAAPATKPQESQPSIPVPTTVTETFTSPERTTAPRVDWVAPTNVLGAIAPGNSEALHTLSLDFATMWASDILLADELVEYRQTGPASDVALTVSHGHTGLRYVPESLIEQAQDVEDDRFGCQLRGRLRASDQVAVSLRGGAYSGYMDYRSLWLNEHFRQLFSARQGYEVANPWGCNVSSGIRWEYLPAAGFVQGDLEYQHDVISPGYEVSMASFPPKLDRFRDSYDTLSGKLSLENVLTRRVRSLQELQITSTTSRELRFALQSSLNLAFAEEWVARLAISGTTESPHFQAASAGITLERDWDESWWLSLTARYYRDNGEVENALLIQNTSAPSLETFQAGLGLRWKGQRTSVKLFAGPYFVRYEQSAAALSTFPHLYANRDWFAVQFAFAHEL